VERRLIYSFGRQSAVLLAKGKGESEMGKPSRRVVAVTICVIAIVASASILVYLLYASNPTQMSATMGTYRKLDLSPYNFRMVEHGKIYNLSRYHSGLPHSVFVMDLNGTYAEMGYAQGQLVGPLIRYMVDSCFYTLLGHNKTMYDWYHDHVIPENMSRDSKNHRDEIKAIYQACINEGFNMSVPSLNRNWDECDLWLANMGYEINVTPFPQTESCSGLGVWGLDALNGKTVIGRNFDFWQDPAGYDTQLNLIIIYRGNGSRNDVISFGYPGSVGVITAFNDKGVWLSSDSTNGGFNKTSNRDFVEIAARNFLEHQNGSHVEANAIQFFTNVNALNPFLYLVGSNTSSVNPVFVLEGNDSMVVAREAHPPHNYVYVSVYQRILMTPMPPSVDIHYQTLTWDFGNLTTSPDYVVSPDECRQMLKDVKLATISCSIFFPSTLQFSVGYAWINAQDGQVWHRLDFRYAQYDPLFNCTIDYHDL
jgi:hypothetical protein